MQKKKKM